MDYQKFSKAVISHLLDTFGLDVDDLEIEGMAKDVAEGIRATAGMRRCGPLSPAEVEPGMFVTILNWNEETAQKGPFVVTQVRESLVGQVLKVEAISIPFLACVHVDTDHKVSLDMRRLTVGELSAEYVEAMEDKEEE